MKVTLIKHHNEPISIGYGPFCFSIENGGVADNVASKIGCQQIQGKLAEYNRALALCRFAWEHSMYDEVVEQ